MACLWEDFRYGVRMLVKYPMLSMAAVLTFGLGIGLTTTVFSVVNAVAFKGLPFENGDRLVALLSSNPSQGFVRQSLSVHDLAVWRDRQTVFDAGGEYIEQTINLSVGSDRPVRFQGAQLSLGAWETLGVEPVLGRGFRAGEDRPGAEPVLLIGHNVWRDTFGSSPDVLGRTVRANSVTRTIVGVMPEGFAFPAFQHLWIPLTVDPLATPRGQGPTYRFVGRLAPGVAIADAQAQASAVAAQLAEEFPETNEAIGARVLPFTRQFMPSEIYALLYTMLGAGIGVLLIACVNVSNLLLARASLRVREVAVRMAMGASRARVVRQMMTEVGVLSIAGAGFGLLLSAVAMRWFVAAIASIPLPFWVTFDIDYRVLTFVTAATAVAALFAGGIPALQATGTNVAASVKDDSRGSTGMRIGRFSSALVVAEVAVSCGLLIAAGLMIKSVVQLRNLPLPFATEDILTARIGLPREDYPDVAACTRFYQELLPRVRAVPGVEAATLSDGLPAAGNGAIAIAIQGVSYPGRRDYPLVREGIVTPGYFETFQTPILEGREFLDSDTLDAPPVAIVNESFVSRHFPDGVALGRYFKKRPGQEDNPWLRIVGVVPDLLMQGIGNQLETPAGYYIPIAQGDVTNFVSIAVRSRTTPGALTPGLRSAVAELDANLPIYDVLGMTAVMERQTGFYTVFGSFFMVFGSVALLLAVAGLYGVMSFSVTHRTREMGIRTALGAQGGQLVSLVMRSAAIRVGLGLALGMVLGLVASGGLQPLLYEVAPQDPLVLAVVPVALLLASGLAGFLPARRAARIDPVIALVAE